ncbi:PocR ligand-binding domain-containing protein [Geosporobacter ferrireducens]|uniref:sensor histidine kinase n=1 Tax=Geosporobacter ferrireducens TaxID=1424294 RepID=UPI00139B2753|nr:PocR ligand-binding domain-containing protein [Geosporobacter ferrireducens]MTI55378.1 hypothetical protein [Geosporobacter ferrireducens]
MELERLQEKRKNDFFSLVQVIEKNGKEICKKSKDSRYYLKELMDIEKLEQLQEQFSKATGFAFTVVDFKGDEITKRIGCSEFCKGWRAEKENRKVCNFCDTYGRLESIINQKPNIYRCPAGLIEVTVPLIIKEQYLGAVLFGQVRCTEEDGIVNIGRFIQCEDKRKSNSMLMENYEQTSIVSYKKILSTIYLIQLTLCRMLEKEADRKALEEENKRFMAEMIAKKIRAEMEKAVVIAELKRFKEQMNPYLIVDALKTIENAALTERAEKTKEMAFLFSEMFKYTIENTEGLIDLIEDIKQIERYLQIQKIRFIDKLNYSIEMQGELEKQKIPPFIILPFIENAVEHGILVKKYGGTVRIRVYMENTDAVIEIEDNGVGMAEKQMKEIFPSHPEDYEKDFIGISIQNIRKRLIYSFGFQYDVQMTSKKNAGTIVTIRIPCDKKDRLSF